MANGFGSGLQTGMQMARDIRSANLAQADRAERRKYREEDLALRKDAAKLSKRESKTRVKSLKEGMKRARRAESRDMSVKSSELLNANLQRQIAEQKLENLQNPSINLFKHHKGLLEEYQKNIKAADQRHSVQIAPINKAIEEAKQSFTASATIPNLVATRDKMLADHKDFKAGLEQAFMSASNQPHEGKWSIRPYFNEFTNSMSYGAVFEGGSAAEAKSALHSIKSMGGNVGTPPNATPATPAAPLNPSDPLGIRQPAP